MIPPKWKRCNVNLFDLFDLLGLFDFDLIYLGSRSIENPELWL